MLRGTGLTEGSDALLCTASVWLVRQQKKSGAWPVWMSGDPREIGEMKSLVVHTPPSTPSLAKRKASPPSTLQCHVLMNSLSKMLDSGLSASSCPTCRYICFDYYIFDFFLNSPRRLLRQAASHLGFHAVLAGPGLRNWLHSPGQRALGPLRREGPGAVQLCYLGVHHQLQKGHRGHEDMNLLSLICTPCR